MTLILKHIPVEGPGTLGAFLERKGFSLKTVELQEEPFFPGDFGGIDAVVSLGGPMNVYEEGRFPFLREEDAFARAPRAGTCWSSTVNKKKH